MATIERFGTTPAREGVRGVATDAVGQTSLGTLVATAGRDMSDLVRGEIELAKAEMKQDIRHAASGGAMFAVAALCGLFCLIAASFAAAYGIHALGITLGWSWLIVAGAYLVIAGLAALIGKVVIGRVGATKTSVREAKDSVAMFKQLRPKGGGDPTT